MSDAAVRGPAAREPFGRIVSAAVLLPRDNIDTDQVIPARFLKTIDRAGLADHLFPDWGYPPGGAPPPAPPRGRRSRPPRFDPSPGPQGPL